jgi:hypothetical protein
VDRKERFSLVDTAFRTVVLPLVKAAHQNPGWREFNHRDHRAQRDTLQHQAIKDIKNILGVKHMRFYESGMALFGKLKSKASGPAYANCPELRQGKAIKDNGGKKLDTKQVSARKGAGRQVCYVALNCRFKDSFIQLRAH